MADRCRGGALYFQIVATEVLTRAAVKKKVEAEAAAEAELCESQRLGAARKAFGAMSAARPVK